MALDNLSHSSAAMFIYLAGFRVAAARPFQISEKLKDGTRVVNAKHKKGHQVIVKLREWSTRLRVDVARAKQTHKVSGENLFANLSGLPYS